MGDINVVKILDFFAQSAPIKSQLPPRDKLVYAINTFKALTDSGLAQIYFTLVDDSSVPEFLNSTKFVDAYVHLHESLCFHTYAESEFGSGTGNDFAAASCHALSEALERLLPKMGGARNARPTAFSAFSLLKKSWTNLEFDPLNRSIANNPFVYGGGQAVHPLPHEALRNAFCEVIERSFIANMDGTEEWFDITDCMIAHHSHFHLTQQYWHQRGFDFHVAVAVAQQGPFVVVASARNRIHGEFPAVYRGSACDFFLDYAPHQAVSELNRSAIFGPYQDLSSRTQALAASKNLDKSDYYFGYISRLVNGDWLSNCSVASTKISVSRLRQMFSPSPQETLNNILQNYEDVFVVPYSTEDDFGCFGCKICIPKLSLAAVERLAL